jgi:hypothetical protein
MEPKNRTKTTPGIGDSGGIPRFDSKAIRRAKTTMREEDGGAELPREEQLGRAPVSKPPGSGRGQRAVTGPPSVGRRTPQSWEPESTTATRRKRPSREPLKVDTVGEIAVKMAKAPTNAPKLLVAPASLSRAPIDQRAAFLLSLVDGQSDMETIISAAGMPEAEVRATFERLVRLGLVSLP